MRDGHLGDLVAPLVDGELTGPARDRALAHAATCSRCREELETERQLKTQLVSLPDPPVPADLALRLYAMSDGDGPGRTVGFRGARRLGRPHRTVRMTVPRLALVGAASVVIGGIAAAAAVGGGDQPSGPLVTPAVDRFVYEHAATTDEVPLANPGATVSVSYAGVTGR